MSKLRDTVKILNVTRQLSSFSLQTLPCLSLELHSGPRS